MYKYKGLEYPWIWVSLQDPGTDSHKGPEGQTVLHKPQLKPS